MDNSYFLKFIFNINISKSPENIKNRLNRPPEHTVGQYFYKYLKINFILINTWLAGKNHLNSKKKLQ